MRQHEPRKVNLVGTTFYVYPFGAKKSVRISGDIASVISPLFSVLGASRGNFFDVEIGDAAGMISKAFSNLEGKQLEKLIDELLLDEKHVCVDYNGSTVPLTEDLLDDLFCFNAQDLYILAYEVIKTNYSGFFEKLGNRFGGLAEMLKSQMISENTEN